MDHQPTHYSDRIEAQLFPHGCGVIHLQDLAGDEEHDTKGEVPYCHCHDLHDGLIEALAEAHQGGPAVTHAAQHDAHGGGEHDDAQHVHAIAGARL